MYSIKNVQIKATVTAGLQKNGSFGKTQCTYRKHKKRITENFRCDLEQTGIGYKEFFASSEAVKFLKEQNFSGKQLLWSGNGIQG